MPKVTPDISIIVAVARNGVIGADNDMPWRLPSDLKRFKALTIGKPIIMGRRTYDSIGRPLPGRLNIVISRNTELAIEGCIVVASLKDALAAAAQEQPDEIFIIGGGQIYLHALNSADTVYLTRVDAAPKGDTIFPSLERPTWFLVHDEDILKADGDSANTQFQIYKRQEG